MNIAKISNSASNKKPEYTGSDSIGELKRNYDSLKKSFAATFKNFGETGLFEDTFDTFVIRKTNTNKIWSNKIDKYALRLFAKNKEIILNQLRPQSAIWLK